MRFKNGDKVGYRLPSLTIDGSGPWIAIGEGVVRGIASIEVPFVGPVYIVEDLSNNFPNEKYPYSHMACPDIYLF